MPHLRPGPLTLASAFEPLLHPKVRALRFESVPGIDCGNCRMVRLGIFSARTKCCTITPDLPNFLVGEILEQETSSEGKARVQRLIQDGRGDPLFLYAPPALRQAYKQSVFDNDAPALPCDLLDENGHCTIYEHRPFLCAGYHCAYPSPSATRFLELPRTLARARRARVLPLSL